MTAPACKVACAPYGPYCALPVAASFLGLLFVSIGAFSCELFVAEANSGTVQENHPFGFTALKQLGTCIEIPDMLLDSPLKAGNGLGIVQTVFGTLHVAWLITTFFVTYPMGVFIGTSVGCFIYAVLGACVVSLGYASDYCKDTEVNPALAAEYQFLDCLQDPYGGCSYKCVPGAMGYVAIIGTLSWIVAGISILFIQRFEKKQESPETGTTKKSSDVVQATAIPHDHTDVSAADMHPSPTTVIEIVNNPDGTQTKTTTNISYDENGQKIIEKMIEQV